LFVRALRALLRSGRFLVSFERSRPHALLIFSSAGASFVEKSIYAAYGHLRGSRVLFFLRDGAFMLRARRSPAYRSAARILLRSADVVLCQTLGWREFFVAEIGIEPSRCEVVENWTIQQSDLAIGEGRSYGSGPKIRLLFLGWMEETKGILDLLAAFRFLLDEVLPVDVELILAGGGRDLDRCKDIVASAGLAGVRFLGWISGEAKQQTLKEADIFVLPSHFEGLSNAMLEAMAAGLPVVVTRVGGLPDVIHHEVDGLLVEPRDVAGLRDALLRLIGDRSLREALGLAARAKAGTFCVERAVDQLLDLASRQSATRGPGINRA
jgi:glycosyltransferase involved in cell wall biosynthesis